MGDAAHGDWAQDPDRRNGKVLRVNRDGSCRPTTRSGPATAIRPSSTRSAIATRRESRSSPVRAGRTRRSTAPTATTRSTGFAQDATTAGHASPATTIRPARAAARTPGRPGLPRGPRWRPPAAAFVNNAGWGTWNKDLFVSTLKESDLRRLTLSTPAWGVGHAFHASTTTAGAGCARRSWRPVGRLFLTTSNGSNDKVIRITPN